MNKLRKAMMVLGVILATSFSFVSCSDDGPVQMGQVPVNSCRVTSNSVSIYWSTVPNENCAGYQVVLYQGSRENLGQEVTSNDYDNRTYKATYGGLQPATVYTVAVRSLAGEKSGLTDGDFYYRQFATAPLISVTASNATFYKTEGVTSDGSWGKVIRARVTLTWPEQAVTSAGGYELVVKLVTVEDGKETTSNVGSFSTDKLNVTSTVADGLIPGRKYIFSFRTRGNGNCDYSYSDYADVTYTVPAAPAA